MWAKAVVGRSVTSGPKAVFLDQNKWIDLFRAFDNPKGNIALFQLGNQLKEAVKSGKLIFPLTVNVLIETYRMNNDDNRSKIAEVQAKFSQGLVFRDRNIRIRHEIEHFIRKCEGLSEISLPSFWWLSQNFIEAFVDLPTAILSFGLEPDQLDGIRADPKFALYHWIAAAPSEERGQAMQMYNSGSDNLIQRIRARIAKLSNESIHTRRKVYSAVLALDEGSRILSVAQSIGLDWNGANDIGEQRLKSLMREVPSYSIEIELASRIESMNRPIQPNDLRDMQAYVSAIPYADVVVGEKMFVNMATQAGLGKRFGCNISTNIQDLEKYI